jgi:hypothetical protein
MVKTLGIKKSIAESKDPAFCLPIVFSKLLARSSIQKQFHDHRFANEFLGIFNA